MRKKRKIKTLDMERAKEKKIVESSCFPCESYQMSIQNKHENKMNKTGRRKHVKGRNRKRNVFPALQVLLDLKKKMHMLFKVLSVYNCMCFVYFNMLQKQTLVFEL